MVLLYDISLLICWKPFPTKQVKHNGAHKHMLKVHELFHESKKAKKVIANIKHNNKKYKQQRGHTT